MSEILEDVAMERLDLFKVDAVAEIAEGAAQGRMPLAYRSEWDDDIQAYVVAGVEIWESSGALPDDTE